MARLITAVRPAPRRPLVGLALSWTAGLGAAYLWPAIPAGAALASAALCGAAALVLRPRPVAWLAHGAVLLTALTHGLVAQPGRRADDIARWLQGSSRYFDLVLRVSSAPARQRGDETNPGGWRWRGVVEAVRTSDTEWRSAWGHIEVWMADVTGQPDPAYGDRWRIGAVVRRGEDGRLRLFARGPAERLPRKEGSSLVAWCYRQRDRARDALRRGIEDWTGPAEIIPAMMLGYREEVPDELRERFLRTGTAHVFAISGLHVGMFSVVLAAALRTAGVPRRWWGAALIPLLALYTVATGGSVSALRAFAIAAVWWLSPVVRRRPDLPTALAAAALLILAIAPSQIAEPGFWYSFIVVAGLAALTPPIESAVLAAMGWTEVEPPRDVASLWHTVRRTAGRGLLRLVAASLAAWIASTPLTAYTGHQISPAALPGNLLVIPVSFLIVLTGCISLVAGLASEWLAVTLNHANAAICAGLVRGVDAIFALPGSHFAVLAPPLWATGLMYGAIAGLLLFEGRVRLTLLIAAAVVAAAGLVRYVADDHARIVLAPPDLAPAILLDAPGERDDWLISPGPAWRAERLVRWLRSCGVDRLDAMVIPVLDANHAGAAPAVLARIPTRRILVPAGRVQSRIVGRLLDDWRRQNRRLVTLAEADEGTLPGAIVWDVWHPPRHASYARSADGGLWLRIARGRVAILLAGPATPAQVDSIERVPFDPVATVVLIERQGTPSDHAWRGRLGAKTLIEHARDRKPMRTPPASLWLPAP